MSDPMEVTGGCLCGSVRYKATLTESSVGVCHCDMCRRWSGGIYMVVDCEDKVAFENPDEISVYESSDWGERGFCKKCGTSLFWKMRDKDSYMMSAGTLDNTESLKLDHEIFIEEKPAYYAFAQDTKKMTGEEVFAYFSEQNKGD